MPVVPYPPPYTQTKTEENQVLRPLGAILELLAMLLAVPGIIFHQNGAELVFALLIAILSVRIFVLWLGDTQQSHRREPFTPPQPTSRNSQALLRPYAPPPGYVVPQQSSFSSRGATDQMTVPFAPATPAAPGGSFVPATVQGLPPSVRPQAARRYASNQAHPPDAFAPAPPMQSFPPPVYLPAQAAPPALLPPAGQTSAHRPYTHGQPVPPAFPAQNGQSSGDTRWRQPPTWEDEGQE